MPDIAPHYQLVVERKGSLDQVTVEIEAAQDVVADAQTYARIARAAQHQIKSMVGISTEVLVKKPGEIPRSMGKAVRVRDLRPKQP
jgi:phenylacetate-CoA ligase